MRSGRSYTFIYSVLTPFSLASLSRPNPTSPVPDCIVSSYTRTSLAPFTLPFSLCLASPLNILERTPKVRSLTLFSGGWRVWGWGVVFLCTSLSLPYSATVA